MNRICPKCGFHQSKKPCECCRRLSQWEQKDIDIRLRFFPPLIRKNLRTYTFPKVTEFKSTYFFGEPGSGKTTKACYIVYQLMRRCIAERVAFPTVHFVSVPELLIEIRNTYNKDSKNTEKDIIDKYTRCDWLILDDLGSEEKSTDWTYQMLYVLINNRYLNLSKTIITSNYSLSQLEIMWQDSRITQRIAEICEIRERNKILRK